jgi:DNA helicase-2/ATP-dependent DNA helicase PcrA
MTVHVAKGSEYKVIFIAAFNEGIFPVSISGQTANLEEERRIAYVALTRAMERLYITCSLGHSFVTNAALTQSRFLKEMDIKNLKLAEQKMKSISNADLS